jgi:hypothetical protein
MIDQGILASLKKSSCCCYSTITKVKEEKDNITQQEVIELLFLVTLVHSPELCFGNKEYNEEGKRWFTDMKASAEKYGVKVHGAWVCPIEHVFYMMLESNDFKAISGFLSPPILTHHEGKISPLITVEEAFEAVKP